MGINNIDIINIEIEKVKRHGKIIEKKNLKKTYIKH